MKNEPVIDMERALREKEIMQERFVRKHGYESSILVLLINHFKGELKKRKGEKKE